MAIIHTEQITIPGIYVNLLIDTVAHWGVTADELLAGSPVNRLRLQDPFWQIDYQTFTLLMLRAAELTGEPAVAFYTGMQVKISSYGLLGFTIMVAKNLREAVDLTLQFVRLQIAGVSLRLELQGKLAVVYIEPDAIDRQIWIKRQVWIDRMAYEIIAAALLFSVPSTMEAITGQPMSINFDFECEKPDYFQRIAHLLTGNVNYSQPYFRISFDASYLDMPCLMADSLLQAVMRENCEKELNALIGSNNMASQIRRLIQTDVVHFNTVEKVATHIHLSSRSLQRKLNEAGQSFKEIYDDVFKKKSMQLLRESSLSVEQIAEQLGYGSASSFIRSYKRLTGETPRQHAT